MASILSFSGVSKRYHSGDFWRPIKAQALQEVSFELEEGDVFGLIGLNGAGKTTLMKTAVGLLRPDRGKVQIFGLDPQSVEAKRHFGYLPELPYFPKYLSAWEVLLYYGRLHGMRGKDLAQRCEETLKLVGLREAAKDPMARYSKGMQQRVGLAQTLLHRPKLVFLDEPMSGLDPKGNKELRDIIQGLRAQGTSLFFNSHILDDVERICDRVGIMHRGRMLRTAGVAELVADFASNVTLGLGALSDSLLQKAKRLRLPMRQENKIWTLEIPYKKLSDIISKLKRLGIKQVAILSYGSPLETALLTLSAEADRA